jgi:hypothetical protein
MFLVDPNVFRFVDKVSLIKTGVIWYFEPHGKLNPGSIYLWYFDPGFNFPYGILTPRSFVYKAKVGRHVSILVNFIGEFEVI